VELLEVNFGKAGGSVPDAVQNIQVRKDWLDGSLHEGLLKRPPCWVLVGIAYW